MSKKPISIDEELGMFDKPENVKRLLRIFYACVVLSLSIDLFYHKHVHYPFEDWFAFYGWYGFISCFFLVIAARGLRRLVMRDEDYYDRDYR